MTPEELEYHHFVIYGVVLLATAAKLASSWQILIQLYGATNTVAVLVAIVLDICLMIIIYWGIRDYLPADIRKYAILYVIVETLYRFWWTINIIPEGNFLYWETGRFVFQALPLIVFAQLIKEFNILDQDPTYGNNAIVHSTRISIVSEFTSPFLLFSGFSLLLIPALPILSYFVYLLTMVLYPLIYGSLLILISMAALGNDIPPNERWVTPAP